MKSLIDCFFVGHNEMIFSEYVSSVKALGESSGSYRDLNLNMLQYNGNFVNALDIINLISRNDQETNSLKLSMSDTFSNAIAYLGSYLNKRDLTFDYINSFQENKKEFAQKLSQENIRTIAIVTTLYVIPKPVIEIINYIRKFNKTAKIILGGPFVSNLFRVMDQDELNYLFEVIGADFYVNSSQGETALCEIINSIKSNNQVENISNICYRKGDGFQFNQNIKENNNLAENRVNWSLFADRVKENVAIRTTISCPFKCSFCGFPEHAGKYQVSDVDSVEKELDSLRLIKSIKNIHFIDDTFNVPPKRFKELLRMIIKNKYDFKWHAYFRCQYADRETIQLMKESGCTGVFLGIESGSNKILENMNKTATVEEYYKGIQLLKEHDIICYGNFIVGFPGETQETVNETIKFIEESGLDFFRAQLWYCDSITPIWKQKEKYGISGGRFEWKHNTMSSQTACDIIDEMFLSVKNAVWTPLYNFDFHNLMLLIQKIGLERSKSFLNAFNGGIKEKILNPEVKEVGFDVITQIENSIHKSGNNGILDGNNFQNIF